MGLEAKVLEIKEKKKLAKVRVESLLPIHIADVWRLFERSIRDAGESYPDTTEDSADHIRSILFHYMTRPLFAGLIAKVGRRPVGILLGDVQERPFGRPKRFVNVSSFWVDPKFRRQGVGKALWESYSSRMKKAEIYHFEGHATGEAMKLLPSAKPVLNVLGGKL